MGTEPLEHQEARGKESTTKFPRRSGHKRSSEVLDERPEAAGCARAQETPSGQFGRAQERGTVVQEVASHHFCQLRASHRPDKVPLSDLQMRVDGTYQMACVMGLSHRYRF